MTVPCGMTLGHGECCTAGYLCGKCQMVMDIHTIASRYDADASPQCENPEDLIEEILEITSKEIGQTGKP